MAEDYRVAEIYPIKGHIRYPEGSGGDRRDFLAAVEEGSESLRPRWDRRKSQKQRSGDRH